MVGKGEDRMGRKQYSVYKRKAKKGGKTVTQYVARYFDGGGRIVKTKLLQAHNMGDGVLEAEKLMKESIGLLGDDPLVLDFLADHWRVDSKYATMKEKRGKKLSTDYILTVSSAIHKNLKGPLEGIRLHELDVPFLENLVVKLSEAGATNVSINQKVLPR
jgi:hypothetical protein